METPSASNGLANSGFIPYDTPAAIPAAIPIAVLLSLFIAGAKILLLLPKCPTSTPLTTLVGRIGVGHTLILGGMSHNEWRQEAHRADERGTLWRNNNLYPFIGNSLLFDYICTQKGINYDANK